jgi:hypothetical protein
MNFPLAPDSPWATCGLLAGLAGEEWSGHRAAKGARTGR